MRINLITNFDISKNYFKNEDVRTKCPKIKENYTVKQSNFNGSVGGTTGVLTGEILAIILKSLIGLTGTIGIVTVATLSMLGIGILGERIEERITQNNKNV